ncbi:MAG: HEAT repeat domain-containing protein [Balneolales bacterium]
MLHTFFKKAYGIARPIPYLTILIVIIISGCSEEKQETIVHSVTDEEAEQYSKKYVEEVSPKLNVDDLEVSIWASEGLVADPVAIQIDNFGRTWAAVTERRRSSEFDIRNHRNWMIESVTFNTIEEQRDFVHTTLDPSQSEKNDWLIDRNKDGSNDWHDLVVEKESIYMLEDLTGNGFANKSSLFFRDFHDEITGVAGAVLFHEGDVFMGVAPDLWRITDTNNDGIGDKKESISHGYGVQMGYAGHGMSGLTVGPDGRIYWSVGDIGLNVTTKEGENLAYPRQGAILRSEPDGSNFEVYAAGLRNTHEFTFDKYGNLITVDNDGDFAGEFERLVYPINGSDSGWRINWQFGKYNDPKNNEYKVWMDEEYFKPRFDNQSAHILPPIAAYHSGPAGMAYNPGTALSDRWKDHFFLVSFRGSPTNSVIYGFTLKENGASFELDKDQSIVEGILATGLDFGPDGALYFADWIEGWHVKGKGRIWKLDTAENSESSARVETKNLLAEDFSKHSSNALLGLLEHEDMRVRLKAQFELVKKDGSEYFLRALDQKDNQLARIHGIWGLAQLGRKKPDVVKPLIDYLKDADSEIRAQAAKMLGDVSYKPASEFLMPLLKDGNSRVRFFATEALGRIGYAQALNPIIEMLEANDDQDVYLRHGGAIALERIGDDKAIAELANHPSRAVRIAAVVALKRLESPEIISFLKDDDEFIVTNAARAINDDAFITDALPALALMLEQNRFFNEPLIRRAINANLYEGKPVNAARIAAFSLKPNINDDLKIEALKALSVWPEPSTLDRVTGAPRGTVRNNLDDAHKVLEPTMDQILANGNSNLKTALIETVSSLNYTAGIPKIMAHLDDPDKDVRIATLNALVELEYDHVEEALSIALKDEQQDVRINALSLIPGLKLAAGNSVALIGPVIENGTIEERKAALETLGDIDDPATYAVLDRQMDKLMDNNLPRSIHLDLILATEAMNSDALQNKLQLYQSLKDDNDPLSAYQESLYGGNAATGRRIFLSHESAQCIRCHTVTRGGGDVGPNLSFIGDRLSRRQILQSMIDPAAELAPGFGTVKLTMQDGQTVTGVLANENDRFITVSRGTEKKEYDKDHVTERLNSPSSMPAMGSILNRQEIRDLVEYMATLKKSE